jgi:Ni,Fe-hydrogenase I small subunit
VRLHNPVLAYDVGDAFMRRFERAAAGQSDPFILVVEGSIPNEALKTEGYWAAFGMDPHTGQPIPTCTWIDRLAPQAWARAIHALRKYTQTSLDVEPAWRQPGPALTTGHHPTTC